MWLVLAAVLISAANAIARKAFSASSNAYLEVQWYLFAAVFLLGAGHVLLLNEHVRIDALSAIAGRGARRSGSTWSASWCSCSLCAWVYIGIVADRAHTLTPTSVGRDVHQRRAA
jgi:TRAP-type C4-dicarboxylate transport system permease small subunit